MAMAVGVAGAMVIPKWVPDIGVGVDVGVGVNGWYQCLWRVV